MQLRVVTPEEMGVIHELAASNPDLRTLPGELVQLRALKAAQTAPAPLRPASFAQVLKAFDAGILSRQEVRDYLGLPKVRVTLERVLAAILRPLQVVVGALAPRTRAPRLAS